MKKPLAAALSLAVLVALASPAGAAVPRSKSTQTIPCGDGAHAAQVWVTKTNFAAKNPCDQWLVFHWVAGGESKDETLNVAPGAHFNWARSRMGDPNPPGWGGYSVSVGAPDYCTNWGAFMVLRGSHGKVLPADDRCV